MNMAIPSDRQAPPLEMAHLHVSALRRARAGAEIAGQNLPTRQIFPRRKVCTDDSVLTRVHGHLKGQRHLR